jgi:hypothetical protein
LPKIADLGSLKGHEVNPRLWRRDHQLDLVIISLAIVGVLFGIIHSPYFEILVRGQVFAV